SEAGYSRHGYLKCVLGSAALPGPWHTRQCWQPCDTTRRRLRSNCHLRTGIESAARGSLDGCAATLTATATQATRHASSNVSRGARGWSLLASPDPRLHRKFDLMVVPAKNAASTLALSKPDMGPQSRPRARAASMKYAPWSDEFRSAVYSSTSSGKSLNHAFAS